MSFCSLNISLLVTYASILTGPGPVPTGKIVNDFFYLLLF